MVRLLDLECAVEIEEFREQREDKGKGNLLGSPVSGRRLYTVRDLLTRSSNKDMKRTRKTLFRKAAVTGRLSAPIAADLSSGNSPDFGFRGEARRIKL